MSNVPDAYQRLLCELDAEVESLNTMPMALGCKRKYDGWRGAFGDLLGVKGLR